MRRWGFLLVFSLFCASLFAAEAPPDILKTDLMVVVAHPDDEGMVAGVIARYALGEHKTIACIYATRGEGGGNAVGTQLGPALGELREAELRETLRRMGVYHVYFLDKTDWAYTESAAATLTKWGHDDSLDRLVRLVRNLRPEVIATFLPAPTGGQHGHHQTAGLLATEAFDAAADPAMFPEQLHKEGLKPWQVKRLYYVGGGDRPDATVTTDGKAPDGRSFAEIAAEAESHHTSQGRGPFTGYQGTPRPSTFRLAKSAVSSDTAHNDLLGGLRGDQKLLVSLEPETYRWTGGQTGKLHLIVTNHSSHALGNLRVESDFPAGWTLEEMAPKSPEELKPGDRRTFEMTAKAPSDLKPGEREILLGMQVSAADDQGVHAVEMKTGVLPVPSIEAEIVPLPGIERYREWTRAQRIERFAGVLPSWVPMAAGQTGTVRVRVSNQGLSMPEASVHLSMPPSWKADPTFQLVSLPTGELKEASFQVTPPAESQIQDVTFTAEVEGTGQQAAHLATAMGTAQITPYAEAGRAAKTITVDGNPGDWANVSALSIPHTNLVEGSYKDDADGSGMVQVAYDDRFLYVLVRVKDDMIVSNIAPDDIKGHWRSDSVEICVDPTPRSESTLTTFKMGVFPWDTAGNVRAERDADANQGPIEETAPETRLASKHTEDGYLIETAIPWSSIGAKPEAGKQLGFNVILYDGDKKGARIGENINEGRLAWSYRPGIWGRPEQWGALRLK
jgi:LmbE family N-acetylglucosaminyl deacetylase